MKKLILILLTFLIILGASACSKNEDNNSQTNSIDNSIPDYSLDENWSYRVTYSNSDYDLIFLYGTCVFETDTENGIAEICDKMRTTSLVNFNIAGRMLSTVTSSNGNSYKANVYIPLYRQTGLYYALDKFDGHDDIIENDRLYGPIDDLIAALDYYFENYNPNAEKPFVIAGHSQGSAMLQAVIEDYFINGDHKDYLKNMIAAYSTSYGVSKKWFDSLDKQLDGEDVIHFATGAYDYNCLISWNSEGEGADTQMDNFLLSDDPYDTYVINPLNWKTDETPASIDENLGVYIVNNDENDIDPNSTGYIFSSNDKDKFSAQINLQRGTVVCSQNNGNYVNFPAYGGIWGGKSLHVYDGLGFYMNMNVNLGDRIDAFLNK